MKYFILMVALSGNLYAKMVNEEMTVTQMNWSAEKRMWRLTMLKHAAVYWAPKELEECLLESVHEQKSVQLYFETKNLHVSKCLITHSKD